MKFIGRALVLVFLFAWQGTAQTVKTAYPSMAPLPQYLMPRDAEISLARSAAPKSISDDATILLLTKNGYQRAVRGTNGFVCMVARPWSADFDDPDFWDPRLRAPICYNALAAKSQEAATIKRTQVVLAGGSKAQVFNSIKAAIDSGEPSPGPVPGPTSGRRLSSRRPDAGSGPLRSRTSGPPRVGSRSSQPNYARCYRAFSSSSCSPYPPAAGQLSTGLSWLA